MGCDRDGPGDCGGARDAPRVARVGRGDGGAMTREDIGRVLAVVQVLAEAIRGATEIPSGHLYAQVMGKIDLAAYEGAIGLLKRAGLVVEKGHVLTWIEPALDERVAVTS